MSSQISGSHATAKVVFYNDPKFRSRFAQFVLLVAIGLFAYFAYENTSENLRKRNIAQGFGFWDVEAGFDISQTLIAYSAASSYGRAFWVGLLNTLLVSLVSIFFLRQFSVLSSAFYGCRGTGSCRGLRVFTLKFSGIFRCF